MSRDERRDDTQRPGSAGISDEDRARLAQWNATGVPRTGEQLLHRLIEAQVRRTPTAPAIEAGGRTLSYAELDACAARLAATLVARTACDGAIIGVCMDRSLELPVVLLAIHKAGAAFLPIDPALPHDRVRYKLEDTACRLVVVHAHLEGQARDVVGTLEVECHAVDAHTATSACIVTATASHDTPTPRCDAAQLAYVMYTSGSTGRPKGVMVPHRAVANHAAWFAGALDITAADRVLHYASISFDAAIAELFAPLVAGATVVMAPPGAQRDLTAIPALLHAERITVVQAVPSAMHVIVQSPAFSDCQSLRYIALGGESLDGALAGRIRRALPSVRLGNFYGPTEAAVDATWFEVTGAIDEARPVPIGAPIANASCHILDEHGARVPIGATGELHIGGTGLALGYLNQRDRTAARFITDVEAPHAPLYRTGDLARWRSDGVIEFLGRTDSQVKLRGYRIELAEVEAPLLADVRVRQAAVVVREDVAGEPTLVAYVVEATPGEVTPRRLRELLRDTLPAWMVPSAICVVAALPLTVNGKLDRAALPAPPSVEDDSDPGDRAQPLDDPLERSLQQIWETTLRIRPIGRDDDFFALGGHSVTALRLLSAVEAAHGVSLRASAFFTAPTIRQQAARIRQPAATGSTVIAVQAAGDAIPIFFAPGGGGEMLVLDALARALGPTQPLHVLDLYAFGAVASALTVRDIAARLVADVRATQPHGPYRLAGYSLGGNIAYEMAQQLRADGEVVAELALLDSDGPGYPLLLPAPVRIGLHLQHALSLGPPSMLRYLTQRLGNIARGMLGAGRMERALYLDADADGDLPPEAVAAVEAALAPVVDAWMRYVPRPYDGAVLLVRASIRRDMIGVVDADPLLGWGPLACGPLRIAVMDCDHFAMLRPAQAARLAAILGGMACAPASTR